MTRLGLVGAGLVGRRHVAAIEAVPGVSLVGVVEPNRDTALDLPWVDDLDDLLPLCDGVILAVPNDQHAPMALRCIAATKPVLIEKPLAGSSEDGARIVDAAGDCPVLVGHHRRHMPLVAEAGRLIAEGALGRLTTLHAQCWLPKPDRYFQQAWRTGKGAGPLFINLIHDVDFLMNLCGPITRVQAMESGAIRDNGAEDTVVVAACFADGLLGTLNLSDAAVGPWSWEMTAHENPSYPATDQTCYWIGGTAGSLALPNLAHWSQPEGPDWWAPISATRMPVARIDPLQAQIAHFADVIAGRAAPLVTTEDGLRALRVVEAIKSSAETGHGVDLA